MFSLTHNIETLGHKTISSIEECGYIASLFVESIYWVVLGKKRNQTVRFIAVVNEARKIGVDAVVISAVLCFAIGIMLAIQGIETLKTFGAQSQVILGIALSVTREFSPLIIGILVAGRSGSSIAARIGTMNESQEIDANRFAAELLMPRSFVIEAVRERLRKKKKWTPEELISDLARVFRVSIQAMEYRLINLGVFMPK